MDIDISRRPSFAFVEITLLPGGAVRVEPGDVTMTRGSSGPAGWVCARLPKSRS